MNVGRGYVMNDGRGYVITRVGIELLGQLKKRKKRSSPNFGWFGIVGRGYVMNVGRGNVVL